MRLGVGLNEDPKCERVGLAGGSSLVREVDFTCQGNNGDRITVHRNERWVVKKSGGGGDVGVVHKTTVRTVYLKADAP